jgi:hypothetical protein
VRLVLTPLHTLMREAQAVARAASVTHLHLRQRIAAILSATLILDLFASVAILFLERYQAGTGIHNYGDSLFWTTTQLLTVSSQLPNPLSPGGRTLDVFLQFWAISVVAAMAGSFGSFFNHRSLERKQEMSSGKTADLINRPLP